MSQKLNHGEAAKAGVIGGVIALVQSSGQEVCKYRKGEVTACQAAGNVTVATGAGAAIGTTAYYLTAACPPAGAMLLAGGLALNLFSDESWKHKTTKTVAQGAIVIGSIGAMCFGPVGIAAGVAFLCLEGAIDISGRVAKAVDPTVKEKELKRLKQVGKDFAAHMYRALELPPNCTDEELRSKYRKLARHCHLDKSWGHRGEFETLTMALNFLKDYRNIDHKIKIEHESENWLTILKDYASGDSSMTDALRAMRG